MNGEKRAGGEAIDPSLVDILRELHGVTRPFRMTVDRMYRCIQDGNPHGFSLDQLEAMLLHLRGKPGFASLPIQLPASRPARLALLKEVLSQFSSTGSTTSPSTAPAPATSPASSTTSPSTAPAPATSPASSTTSPST
eukprot:RCo031086